MQNKNWNYKIIVVSLTLKTYQFEVNKTVNGHCYKLYTQCAVTSQQKQYVL